MYSSPITLTFNKKPTFSTVPGGICTIVSAILILLNLTFAITSLMIDHKVFVKERVIQNYGIDIDKINANAYNISTENTTLAYKIISSNDSLDTDRYLRA